MELKNYQKLTLETLSNFLAEAKIKDNAEAFKNHRYQSNYPATYKPIENLNDSPYICLRLPTGGGKTLLATYAIKIAAENYLETEYPLVLWLVPTDVIRQQTLEILRNPQSFNRQVLDEYFNGKVQIFDITEFKKISQQDLNRRLNIFVATFNSLRREDNKKSSLKVYQSQEDLMTCFENLNFKNYFDEDGKFSFANLLANLRPLMIVDEAHNHNTNLSFEVMRKLRASAIIELTATPIEKKSNVLVAVSAEELKKEDMIKLPIMLSEIRLNEEATIDCAVQKRNFLEKIAEKEIDYLRPLALFQAENKDREWNVERVKKYLIDDLKIPADQIAVATGTQRGLDDIDIFDRECKIKYIITVQALKEGWDCSFAYVFCSLAKVHSTKDAEQLLGRVLRMPYVKRRENDELNKAYAFVNVGEWRTAAENVEGILIEMGFEKPEAKTAIQQQRLIDSKTTIEFTTTEPPKIENLNLALQSQTIVEKIDEGYKVKFNDVTDDDIHEIVDNAKYIFKEKINRSTLLQTIYQKDFSDSEVNESPANRGVKFELPQLCLNLNGVITPATSEKFLPDDWRLCGNYPAILKNLTIDIEEQRYELDIMGHKVTNQYLGDNENNLFAGETNWSFDEFVGFIADHLQKSADLKYPDVVEFTRRIVMNYLDNKIQLSDLVRVRFAMINALDEYINECRLDSRQRGYQKLFDDQKFCVTPDIVKVFDRKIYPLRKKYNGKKFSKHHYPSINDMNHEEEICAGYIDANPNVETWIRNIESDPKNSFWIPLINGKFYPDFLVKLKNGNYAVIEYKGANLSTNEDSKTKDSAGKDWAKVSNCKFLMAVKRDDQGRDIKDQMKELLK